MTADAALGPLETAAQRESVSLALLVLLERLTAVERAVFVLREAFGYPHREIAEVLELTEANCQQLYRRARKRIIADRPRFEASDSRWRQITERFLSAAQAGDVTGLERMLAADVVSWADGGGKSVAARYPIHGAERVARYLSGWVHRPVPGVRLAMAEVNAQPAIVGVAAGQVLGVMVLEVTADKITAVRTIANPDKLAFLSAQVQRPGAVVWTPGSA